MIRIQKVKERGILFSYDVFGDCLLNLYLIKGKARNYVIDSGLGSESVRPVLEELDASKPTVLINTHFHWDHIWGNCAFDNSLIIAHALCPKIIRLQWDETISKFEKLKNGTVTMKLPNLLFDSELYFSDDNIRLFHSPGHTQDGISILDEDEGVLIAGDNIGDTDQEIVPSLFAEKTQFIRSLNSYQKFGFDTIVSGHNEIKGKDIIERILNLVQESDVYGS